MDVSRLVVGVDGSVPARAALRWACARAAERGATVLAVHVVDDEWGSPDALTDDDDAPSLLDAETEYARSLSSGVNVSSELLTGSPMWELARYSDPSTMLVVGTHKSGFHYGRVFGSRSLQLANLVNGPVAIVPETPVRMRRGVLVGVDDTPAGFAAVDVAADFARAHDCELTMVRASAGTVPTGWSEDARREWQLRSDDLARGKLATAADRARHRQPDIVIRSRVVRRSAGIALNELARGAELLVIGDSRRAGGKLGSLGSVAYDVLLNLSSPTLVVHAPVTLPEGALRAER